MILPDQFETERLTLRRPEPPDAARLFAAYVTDQEVTRYLTWRPHHSVVETEGYIAACIENWSNGSNRTYMVDQSEQRTIGAFDLRPQPKGAVSFGYVLARPFWGRGYMTEALRAVGDWALTQEGVWRFWAYCDISNPASARVMQKAGLSFEGTLRRWEIAPNIDEAPRDCHCYARVK